MFVVGREELALFLLRSFLFGALTAAAYLPYGFLRVLFDRAGKKLRFVLYLLCDFLFCLAVAFFACLLVYSSNRGQMRISALLFFAAGFLPVYLLCCKATERFAEKVFDAIGAKIVSPIFAAVRKRGKLLEQRIRAAKNARKEKEFDRTYEKKLIKKLSASLSEAQQAVFSRAENPAPEMSGRKRKSPAKRKE